MLIAFYAKERRRTVARCGRGELAVAARARHVHTLESIRREGGLDSRLGQTPGVPDQVSPLGEGVVDHSDEAAGEQQGDDEDDDAEGRIEELRAVEEEVVHVDEKDRSGERPEEVPRSADQHDDHRLR